MERETFFFIIFFITILITRIFLYIKPTPSPTIKGFRLHHYMYGLLLIIIGIFLQYITIYAIGMGLFFDAIPYLISERKTHGDKEFNKEMYWRKKYVIELIGLIFFVFLLKKYLVFF